MKLLFIDNKNINLNMLNRRGLHLNEYGTTRLANKFCYNMNASWYEICMDAQSTKHAKNVNKILVINIYNPNADRPTNSTADNNKSLSKTNSVEKSTENYAFLLVVAHRLQNPKNITIGQLNVNSLRNKIEAVEELIDKNIEICLLSETKIDEKFS